MKMEATRKIQAWATANKVGDDELALYEESRPPQDKPGIRYVEVKVKGLVLDPGYKLYRKVKEK